MHTDSTGYYFLIDDLVAAAAGLVIGVTGQLVGDLVTSAMIGKWQFSSWQMYAGAAVGGAVGGWLSEYITPVGGAAVGGFISNFIGEGLEKVSGVNDNSWSAIAFSSGVNGILYAATTSFSAYLKIPGVTSGSHSFAQVWKSGVSKSVSRGFNMSMKTIAKGFAYNLVSNFTLGWLSGNVVQGIKAAHDYHNTTRREPGIFYDNMYRPVI